MNGIRAGAIKPRFLSSILGFIKYHTKNRIACQSIWLRGFVFISFVLAGPFFLQGQNIRHLESKRKELVKEIRATSNMLHQTKAEKKELVNRILALNVQISNRRELVFALSEEVDSLTVRIETNAEIVDILANDINNLEEEYGKIMRNAQHQQYKKTPLLFLFSADSFNQALRRWLYIRQYNRYRQKQVAAIVATYQMLEEKMMLLSNERDELETLLTSVQTQSELLNKEKSIKKNLVHTLKKSEVKLSSKLAKSEKERAKLNRRITSLISLAEKANKTASKPASTKRTVTLGKNFRQSKSKLSWPVNGLVTGFFGKHPHPTAPKVLVPNNGVDIRVKGSPSVKNVFQGEVLAIETISGRGLTVLVKHGPFYTVYSHLASINVKKGQKISTLEVIGTAAQVEGKNYREIHFEIWEGKKAVNPITWLQKH